MGPLVSLRRAKRSLVERDMPGKGRQKTGDRLEQRGLAGAVGAADADGLAGVQTEMSITKYRQLRIAAAQTFDG